MEYVVKSSEFVGSPKDTKNAAIGKFFINVKSGIVGDKYGFIKTDSTSFDFEKSSTGNEIEALKNKTAVDFVKTKYPNT